MTPLLRPLNVLAFATLVAALGHAAAIDPTAAATGGDDCLAAADRAALVACFESRPRGGDVAAHEVEAWGAVVAQAAHSCPQIPAGLAHEVHADRWPASPDTCVVWDESGRFGTLVVTPEDVLAMPAPATLRITVSSL